jgi:serine/tyrosine/threonine adenylyltransferase
VHSALTAAEGGDYEPLRRLLGVLHHPYDDQTDMAAEYGRPPQQSERVLQTFCGT